MSPKTEELQIHVRTDGLTDLRRADMLLARIEGRLERLATKAEELGVPLRILFEEDTP
jgi:hypothetical protein